MGFFNSNKRLYLFMGPKIFRFGANVKDRELKEWVENSPELFKYNANLRHMIDDVYDERFFSFTPLARKRAYEIREFFHKYRDLLPPLPPHPRLLNNPVGPTPCLWCGTAVMPGRKTYVVQFRNSSLPLNFLYFSDDIKEATGFFDPNNGNPVEHVFVAHRVCIREANTFLNREPEKYFF